MTVSNDNEKGGTPGKYVRSSIQYNSPSSSEHFTRITKNRHLKQ